MSADHYDVLGVQSDADIAQIKRRYRQLVRQNHPDALPQNQREQAHAQMIAINRAWTVLSDPAARARYDLSQSKSFVVHAPQSDFAPSNMNASASAKSASAKTARVATSSRTSQNARNTNRNANGRATKHASRSRLVTQVFEAAELYFFYGKAGEAIGMCRRVLDQDANNAEAHALMGDIYMDQGRLDVAAFMYERAVRSQPTNALYRKKWEALAGKNTHFSPNDFSPNDFPHAHFVGADSNANVNANANANAETSSAQSSTRNEEVASSSNDANRAMRVASGATLLASSVVLMFFAHFAPSFANFSWPPATPIAVRLLGFSVLGALSLGAALPLLDQIEAFGTAPRRASPMEGAPTSVVVGLASLAFAPLGWAFAVLLSLSTRRLNWSLFSCLALGVLLSSALAFPIRGTASVAPLRDAILWWSGRAVFPALLVGWALGSWLNAMFSRDES